MLLANGNYKIGLSERDMSLVLDALEIAIAASQAIAETNREPVSVFDADDFDELRARFDARFQY